MLLRQKNEGRIIDYKNKNKNKNSYKSILFKIHKSLQTH